jgi:hypothetical protein
VIRGCLSGIPEATPVTWTMEERAITAALCWAHARRWPERSGRGILPLVISRRRDEAAGSSEGFPKERLVRDRLIAEPNDFVAEVHDRPHCPSLLLSPPVAWPEGR